MFDTESSSSSATDNATESIMQALSQAMRDSAFACGGEVKIKQSFPEPNDKGGRTDVEKSGDAATAEPVTIRWDSSQSIEKVTLPTQFNSTSGAGKSVMKLVEDTTPASFGYQGEDFIDETYRKASKLDPTAFSTNFNPYEAGIIDIIAQTLLPAGGSQFQGIRAELYKLNVEQLSFF